MERDQGVPPLATYPPILQIWWYAFFGEIGGRAVFPLAQIRLSEQKRAHLVVTMGY